MYKKYSEVQHTKTYESTIEFVKFISKHVSLKKKNIIDLACGGGANTIYLAENFGLEDFFVFAECIGSARVQ